MVIIFNRALRLDLALFAERKNYLETKKDPQIPYIKNEIAAIDRLLRYFNGEVDVYKHARRGKNYEARNNGNIA